MEKLKVQQVQEIVHRLRQGQSERAIVRDLGYARETVRRYSRLATRQSSWASTVVLFPERSM